MTKKKQYEKPSMVVVDLYGENSILAASGVEDARQDYGAPTEGNWTQNY